MFFGFLFTDLNIPLFPLPPSFVCSTEDVGAETIIVQVLCPLDPCFPFLNITILDYRISLTFTKIITQQNCSIETADGLSCVHGAARRGHLCGFSDWYVVVVAAVCSCCCCCRCCCCCFGVLVFCLLLLFCLFLLLLLFFVVVSRSLSIFPLTVEIYCCSC